MAGGLGILILAGLVRFILHFGVLAVFFDAATLWLTLRAIGIDIESRTLS
ncbi:MULTISPECIES: hypothetical protein [Rhizobium]|nr:hypothetical protein [Rhizobium leguminosarum]MCA2435488.1 hypothetical protein [Rhizobium leguminosarum]